MSERDDDAARRHAPVLLRRCVELLAPALSAPGAVLVDCTLGMGGHTEAILEEVPGVRVIGLDRDAEAIALASARLAHHGERFVAVRAVYDERPAVLAERRLDPAARALMARGASSLRRDWTER